MGTKCFYDVQILDSQIMTNLPDQTNSQSEAKPKENISTIDIEINNKRTTLSSHQKQPIPIAPIESGAPGNPERKISKKPQISNKVEIDEQYERNVLEIIQKHNKKNDDFKLIETCLLKHFFMQGLEKKARQEIISEMSLCSIKPNTYIFKQGGMGIYFYILKQGIVEWTVNDQLVGKIELGESFGELALLHCAPRGGSTKAITQCYLWVLERKNFRKIVDHITKMNFEENKNFIESIPILSIIDQCQKTLLCNSLYKETFKEGQLIVKQGELAHCLYIVKEGEVNCTLNNKVVRILKKGNNFGERSVLVDSTRSLDVVAKTNCICYSVSTITLKTMLGDNYRKVLYLNFIKASFSMSKVFKKLNVQLFDQVIDLFTPLNLKNGDIAYKAGYIPSSKIVVVIDGNLINGITNEIVSNRGEILFEADLLKNSNKGIDYNILPNPDCLLVEADTDKVIKVFGCNFPLLMNKSSLIEYLSKVSILKNLSEQQLENLSHKIGEESFEKGSNIISKGESGTKFYIVKSGKVDIIVNNQYIRTLNEREYFGERSLFFQEKRSATAKAKEKVEVFYLEKEDFLSIIASNMKEHLMNRLSLQDNTVELNDLDYCDRLGSGNYGQVSLVSNKKNNFLYAIKGISKKQIDYEQLHQNLELERSILLQIDHPFIVKLVKTLKDKDYIYFLMEYIKGKELFDVIRDIGLLNKQQTQFYGASMMIAVDYLHQRNFVYRDIKPENILVIKSGYIKLIDFGTAKSIIDRTSTIIGTPHYMAPEVILGEGYSFQIDIWSISICMYEFMCGGVPFGESFEDPMEVYIAIINE